ncbi:MAG: hypothetical protein KAJ53_03470, partial [Anaerolineales bacterium]|nr:hypothetical protein [Anaerolineales bacterium]
PLILLRIAKPRPHLILDAGTLGLSEGLSGSYYVPRLPSRAGDPWSVDSGLWVKLVRQSI